LNIRILIVRTVAWSAALAVAWLGVQRWTMPIAVRPDSPSPPPLSIEVPPPRAFTDSEAAHLTAGNPFRASRQPPAVRGRGLDQPVPTVAAAPTPPRPAYRFTGVLGGPPWSVVLEGVPGFQSGLVIGLNEEKAGVRVRRLEGDTLELTVGDSTIILRLGRTGP
jgi:hypothetical protein